MKLKTPLALMEQLVMVLVFALAAALCVSCFVTADRLSNRYAVRDEAVLAAQTAAETLKGCRGNYEEAAALVEGQWENGVVAVRSEDRYTLVITPKDSGYDLLGCASIDVYAAADDSLLFGITVSWQEVGGHE